MTIKSKTFGTLSGSFGKGVKGSLTVNFSVSGGKYCSDLCELKKRKICYAITTEKVKPSITVNLERKQARLSEYIAELADPKNLAKLAAAPWVRFSAFGSIPAPSEYSYSLTDYLRLSEIAAALDLSRVHFPVETIEKGDLLNKLGFNPRVSAGTDLKRIPLILESGLTASAVIEGEKKARGKNKRKHSAAAFTAAREYNASGIKAKVCPAVAGSAKCGACKLCADKAIDLIIYPAH